MTPLRIAGLAALAPICLANGGAKAEEQIDLTTLSPFYLSDANTYVPGVLPGFTQTATANLLTINGGPDLPSNQSTHNIFYMPVTGDFMATVKSTVGGGAGGGFYADFNAGYAGIAYNAFVVNVHYGFGLGDVIPASQTASVSDITLQLSRLGANLYLAAAIGSDPFQPLYSLTGTSVLGPTGFDLNGSGEPGLTTTSTTTYSGFVIETYAPSAVSGVNGGTASDPIPLPSSTVGSVSGDIGAPDGPTSDYFSFYFEGGRFSALVGVPDADVVVPPPAYEFVLCAGLSCGAIYETVSADSSNAYQNELKGELSAGYYTIGIILAAESADPMYSVVFSTPVIGGNVSPVPEPSTWAMMLLGFAGLGYAAHRHRRKRLSAASA